MKIKGKYIFSVVLVITWLSSCYNDKADLLYPETVCDTTMATSYNQHVVPLLQQYCYGCHTGATPSGGIAMGSYAADRAIANNGKLYGSINYTNGYSPMPQGAAKLTNCQIAIIKRWINASTPNN